MRRYFAIFKKELKRFFTDKRSLAALIFPGILLFLVYSVIGEFFNAETIQNNINKEYQFNIVLTDNYSEEKNESIIEQGLTNLLTLQEIKKPKYTYISKDMSNEYLNKLKNKEIDSLIIFDDNFEDIVLNQSAIAINKPNVSVYYNSEIRESEFLFANITQLMSNIYTQFTINNNINANVGSKSAITGEILGVVIPLISLTLLYSATLTVCPESIAGEKERGTLSSILVTPIKRSEYTLGKISALVVASIFGGAISSIGMLISLPKLISGGGEIGVSIESYILMFFIFISIVVLFVTISTLVSTFAKTIKEATGYLSSLMGILFIFALIPTFVDCSNIGFSFVPILNSVQSIRDTLNDGVDILFLFITLFSTLLYSGIFVVINVKLFNNERVVSRQ